MQQAQGSLTFKTDGPGLSDITVDIAGWLRQQGVTTGLLSIFIRHTSASLMIQENADDRVMQDMEAFFKKLVPEGHDLYSHSAEGLDDMPAHIKSALTQTSLTIPVSQGRMMLGTWQGIYLFEHRTRPKQREITLHLSGE
jgi:secondary thiamine-phosphate synthase enzyme